MDFKKSIQNLKYRDRKERAEMHKASPEHRADVMRHSISNDKWISALQRAGESDVTSR